jgi:hypothetical protein
VNIDLVNFCCWSLYSWCQIFAEHGSVTRPMSQFLRPKCIINCTVLTAIHMIYTEDSDVYLNELCTLLATEHGVIVSQSTLS